MSDAVAILSFCVVSGAIWGLVILSRHRPMTDEEVKREKDRLYRKMKRPPDRRGHL